ncbi:enolase C-terminal domain-like protein [Modestobacter marinus]|uniref:enolase C-terminal domain-like protein n=1 Tax=Modestobacter marinus TaxID=477641 RepID=UPI00201A24DA|nr:enolase C-terminal domain-like protein [Modestobacter marinus]
MPGSRAKRRGAPSDPRVDALEVAVYRLPTDRPEADGTLSWDATTAVVVHASGGGVTGVGWTYADAAAATVVRGLLAGVVLGCPVLDPPAAASDMARAVRNAGAPGLVAMAISAVDVALWDLKARLLDVPLTGLLGAVRADAAVYASGGFTSYDDATTRDQLAGWLARGHDQAKIKIGESWGTAVPRDLARTRLAREVLGDDAALLVDANGGYTAKQAVRVGGELDDLGVVWFEEPVSSDDLAGLRLVRERLDCDVAAGEYGARLPDFAALCGAGAVDCLQVDASRCGGVTEWLRACAVAAGHQLEVSSHCVPALHAHLGPATPNLRHLEWFHDHERFERRLFDGVVEPAHGRVRPPADAPGLGLTVRSQAVEDLRIG